MDLKYSVVRSGSRLHTRGLSSLEEAYTERDRMKALPHSFAGFSIAIYSYLEEGGEETLIESVFLQNTHIEPNGYQVLEWLPVQEDSPFLYNISHNLDYRAESLFLIKETPILENKQRLSHFLVADSPASSMFVYNKEVDSELKFSEFSTNGYYLSSLTKLDDLLNVLIQTRLYYMENLLSSYEKVFFSLKGDTKEFFKNHVKELSRIFRSQTSHMGLCFIISGDTLSVQAFSAVPSNAAQSSYYIPLTIDSMLNLDMTEIETLDLKGIVLTSLHKSSVEYVSIISKSKFENVDSIINSFKPIQETMLDLLQQDIFCIKKQIHHLKNSPPLSMVQFM